MLKSALESVDYSSDSNADHAKLSVCVWGVTISVLSGLNISYNGYVYVWKR